MSARSRWSCVAAIVLLAAVCVLLPVEPTPSRSVADLASSGAADAPRLSGARHVRKQPTGAVAVMEAGVGLCVVRLLDVATGQGAAGVDLVVRHAGNPSASARTLRTDARGEVRVGDARVSVLPADRSWIIGPHELTATEPNLRVLHGLRMVSIRVVVSFQGFQQGSVTKASVDVLHPLRMKPAESGRDPEARSTFDALRERGLNRLRVGNLTAIPTRPDEFLLTDEGTAEFTARVPSIPGYRVVVRSKGWLGGAVDLGAPREGALYQVKLYQASRVSGRLTGPDGLPLANVLVRLHAIRHGTKDDLPLAEAQGSRRAFVVLLNRKTGFGALSMQREVRTAQDCSFGFALPMDVDAVELFARAPGLRPARWRGEAFAEKTEVELRAEALGEDRGSVLFQVGGRPLANQKIRLYDNTNLFAGDQVDVVTDEWGNVPAAWLEVGRHYAFTVDIRPLSLTSHRTGCLRWDGRAVVEFDDLERVPKWP